ncbi:MAG TPA: cytochrome ubiquinol oxidase subunit I [Alphaproteobacteria bacterium]
MDLDPVILSRIQFAFVISFHILFPAFTIGLASFIAMLEGRWLVTRNEVYLRLSKFWTRIFAVSFGMGVVSGIVMSYQFGTNWSRFADRTANVIGPLLSYEVLTAFFLEASFLGILLFGRNRVPPKVFFASALIVAIGTLLSTFWILSANSWMQTPAGYEVKDGMFYVVDWWKVVFNPSFPYRLAHMVTAAFLTTAFVVIGVSAWYLLRGRFADTARAGLSMSLWLVLVLAPLQVFIGDLHGLNTREHQPAKVAAMEANWETQRRMPLVLFAIPDPVNERNRLEIAIPALGSLILTHDWDGEVKGMKDWPREDRPSSIFPFYGFRLMVGLGVLMLFVAGAGFLLRLSGRLYETRWFLRLCNLMLPSGFLAVLAGWFVTETGRQPWLVYGVMRTAEGASPSITWQSVALSLTLFVLVYGFIFGAGVYYIVKMVKRGPDAPGTGPDHGTPARPPAGGTPARPMSASEPSAQEG